MVVNPKVSKVFSEYTNIIGTHRIRTSFYHPQSNGMLKRFHIQIRALLRVQGDNVHSSTEFPIVRLEFFFAVMEDLTWSATYLVYDQSLKLPDENGMTNPQLAQHL